MLEKTFTLIKPEHVKMAGGILNELDQYGKRIITVRVNKVPREVIETHYSVHRGKPFFGYMTESFVGKPVVIAVYEGEDIIQRFIELIGPTDPRKASKGTIRGKYSNDSLEIAFSENRPVENVIHRSDNITEAMREISVWERYFPH